MKGCTTQEKKKTTEVEETAALELARVQTNVVDAQAKIIRMVRGSLCRFSCRENLPVLPVLPVHATESTVCARTVSAVFSGCALHSEGSAYL
eukprot:SAG11_NODE_2527_length_3253_cov_1.733756_4_plen_92_part_00